MRPEERHIRNWLESFVVGMNLCPFARPLLQADNLRLSISDAESPADLQYAFLSELDNIQICPEEQVATTLLAFPRALSSFEDYLNFLDDAQSMLAAAGLEGVIQLASFHPQYCFEGEHPDSPGNYSNRSPYPLIHLLREGMLTRVLADYPSPEDIPRNNIQSLDNLGLAELQRRWADIFTG